MKKGAELAGAMVPGNFSAAARKGSHQDRTNILSGAIIG